MKTRKLLALVLAIALLASFISVPVFAEGEGEALETLGILKGTTDEGVTEEYLTTTATRAQAALINLRLFGLETAALDFEGEATFTDAAEVNEWWQPILEYLKATPSVGWIGYEDGSFKPNDAVNGQEFNKILLVALGYEEGTEFTWETVMDVSATVGLTVLADKAADDLTVDDIAKALYEALGIKINSPTDVTLLSQLVFDGVILEADAVAAGFDVEDPALVIVDAYASAVNEVTVEMSTDVPAGAVITLKKGTAAYSVSKVIDGDTITLTALFNLPAGTYTVSVDGETADFVVMAQHAVDLVIGTDYIYDAGQQDLKVSLLDQYGDAMSLAGTNHSVFNQDTGYVFTPAVSTTLKITPDTVVGTGVAAKTGQEVYIFVYDPVSMLTVSGTVTVKDAPYIAGLEIGGVTVGKIGTVQQTMLFETTTGNILDVNAYDQYGMPYKLTAADVTTGTTYTNKVQILSSNSGVIDPATMLTPNANGDLVFTALSDGSVIITLIIPDQAVVVSSQMITVYALPTLTSITTSGPDEALYANEATDFAVSGFDQYGNAFDVATTDAVVFTSTVDLFGTDPDVTAKNTIGFTPNAAGTSTVYYFLNGIFQGTFDVTVNAAAYPFQITGVDAFMAMEEGSYQMIISEDIEVIDQYGRVYGVDGGLKNVDPFDATGYTWQIVTKAATTLFDEDMDMSPTDYEIWANTGLDTGSATFIAKLVKISPWTVMTESAFSFDVTNVETEDIAGFAMTAIAGPLYMGATETATHAYGQTSSQYWKTVKVTGTYGTLSVLLYDSNEDGLPNLIDVVTSTVDDVEVMSDNLLVPVNAASTATTTTLKAWKNGEPVAMTDLALSKVLPDCVTVTPKAVNTATAGDYTSMFTYKDQYGVALSYTLLQSSRSALDPNYYFYTSHWAVGTTKMMYNVVKWDGSITATYEDTL